jgi:hypothetical protein
MSDLEKKSKKELLDIIDQLRVKLGDMHEVEAKQDALEQELNGVGFSIVQYVDSKFKLVQIKFDFASKAARIETVEEIYPSNYEFALFQAKKFLVSTIMNKDNLNHLKEKKNG